MNKKYSSNYFIMLLCYKWFKYLSYEQRTNQLECSMYAVAVVNPCDIFVFMLWFLLELECTFIDEFFYINECGQDS